MEKKKYEDMDLLKGNGDINTKSNFNERMRSQFKINYVESKGWDILNLTDEQILEVQSQKGYQSPGMICG